MSIWSEAVTYRIDGRTVRAVRGHAITITEMEPRMFVTSPERLLAAFPLYVAPPPDDAARFDGPTILAAVTAPACVAGDPHRNDGISERVAVILDAFVDARYLEPLAIMKPALRVWRMDGLSAQGFKSHAPLAFDDGERRLVVMPRTDTYGAVLVVTVTP